METDKGVAAETGQGGTTATGSLLTRGEAEVKAEPTHRGVTITEGLELREVQATAESEVTEIIAREAVTEGNPEDPEGNAVVAEFPGEAPAVPDGE